MTAPELILSADYIRTLLDETTQLSTVPDDCAVLLEGSIAEGFGNDGSDIDFLVVSKGSEPMPTMPTVLFVDGRRVEVRTRSEAQLRQQLDRVTSGEADEDTLNRVQRFLRAHVVREGNPDIAGLRAVVPYDEFARVMQTWWSARAVQALRYSVALAAMGADEEADGWARDGLAQAMKAWAASLGETYLESKWLPRQLDRIGPHEVAARYRAVESGASLDDVLAAAALTGVPAVDNTPDAVRLQRVPDVTTWPIGGRLHVVRNRRDVFVLSEATGQAWRSVVFGQSVATVSTRFGIGSELAEFVRLGFVGLRWHAEPLRPALAMCEVAGAYSPPPGTVVPTLGVGGAAQDPNAAVTLSPLAADRFAECATTLIWSNIVLENAREDCRGALKNSQWQVADIAAHRLIAMSTRVLLSAFGIHPLPADVAPQAALRRLIPASTPGKAELLAKLARAQHVRFDDPQSDRNPAELEAFAEAVREIANGSAFPDSFASREQWRHTLDISYDWLRLAGYLNAKLPLDEARDLLTSGGVQPHARSDAEGER